MQKQGSRARETSRGVGNNSREWYRSEDEDPVTALSTYVNRTFYSVRR